MVLCRESTEQALTFKRFSCKIFLQETKALVSLGALFPLPSIEVMKTSFTP